MATQEGYAQQGGTESSSSKAGSAGAVFTLRGLLWPCYSAGTILKGGLIPSVSTQNIHPWGRCAAGTGIEKIGMS